MKTVCMRSFSVVSGSLWPQGLQPARLFYPWGFSRQEYWSGMTRPPPGWSSQPRDRTQVSHIAGRFFTLWATRESLMKAKLHSIAQQRRLRRSSKYNRKETRRKGFEEMEHCTVIGQVIWGQRINNWILCLGSTGDLGQGQSQRNDWDENLTGTGSKERSPSRELEDRWGWQPQELWKRRGKGWSDKLLLASHHSFISCKAQSWYFHNARNDLAAAVTKLDQVLHVAELQPVLVPRESNQLVSRLPRC